MALVILAVGVTAFLGVVGRLLIFSARDEQTVRAVLSSERLLFELETGRRPERFDHGTQERFRHETIGAAESGEGTNGWRAVKIQTVRTSEPPMTEVEVLIGDRFER